MKCITCLIISFKISRPQSAAAEKAILASPPEEVLGRAMDAVTILHGKPLCYEHLAEEVLTSDGYFMRLS